MFWLDLMRGLRGGDEPPQTWCCCCKNQVSYRIPALVNLNDDQTFLALAEKRKTLSDTNAEVLVMRRGTLKDAKTQDWVSGHQLLSSACLPNHCSMNPCPVYERESKTLFLFFVCVPTRVLDLTADVIGEQMKEWAHLRLIIPAYVYRYTGKPDCTSRCCLSFCCFTSFALAFCSDDQRITWKVGNQMDVESCECQMAEIIDEEGKSTLYCNARTRLGYRSEALSYNSGEDFGTVLSPNKLIETGNGCLGSVLSFLEQSNPTKTWLLYSYPSNPKNRVDLGLYLN
uniref:Sialidase 3 (membrane sialidase), tandem duplicate 3 n=1 Tax=Sinocyclocheilus rhinocerous TaxID=307959 RepID=A0A673N8B0_9TELE